MSGVKNSDSSRKEVNIFGTRLVSTKKGSVLKQVEDNIYNNRKFLLFTPNPEILLKARSNKGLQDVINNVEIKIADGVGIKFAYRYTNDKTSQNLGLLRLPFEKLVLLKNLIKVITEDKDDGPFPVIKGRELFVDLLDLCSKNNWKVYLLGGTSKVSKKTVTELKKKFKNLKVKSSSGPTLDENAKPLTEKDRVLERKVIKEINDFKPAITFVAFGAPKQELCSSRNLSKLNTRGIMAVGGTFNYISGVAKLPPQWLESLGFEWFWRLITQPKRIGRIIQATVVFPYMVLKYKISNTENECFS
jgi:N-acetylglucosaminyldiphosphoundecaprenol N-acetyl-beta-D-mannosaminyltransferase